MLRGSFLQGIERTKKQRIGSWIPVDIQGEGSTPTIL